MFHSSSRTADKFAEEYDRHGDSYTENATSESLKKVFDNVQGNVSMQELDGLTDNKWLQMAAASFYLVRENRSERENASFGTNLLQSQIFSHLANLPLSVGHFWVSPCRFSKRVLRVILSLFVENEFDLHENESEGRTEGKRQPGSGL